MELLDSIALIILFLCIIVPIVYLDSIQPKENTYKGVSIISVVITFIVFSMLIFYIIDYRKLKNTLQCPEYEKIENVYIRKK